MINDDELSLPDAPRGSRSKALGYRRLMRSLAARQALREIESELREQASGAQDGYLLDVANRMREALKAFG